MPFYFLGDEYNASPKPLFIISFTLQKLESKRIISQLIIDLNFINLAKIMISIFWNREKSRS